jgi:hypothetical protein
MIDWWGVFSNAIWISGAALALAALSYAYWQARVDGQRLRQAIGRPSIQAALHIAGALFSVGMAATARYSFEVIVWLILAAQFIAQWLRNRRTVH